MDSDQVTIFVCVYAEIIYTTVIHGEGRFYWIIKWPQLVILYSGNE